MPMKIHFLPYENPFSYRGKSIFIGMKKVGHPKSTDDRYDFIDSTVKEIDGLLGEDFGNSSEERENSSELSFHSSEVLFHSSVENFRLLGGGSRFPREKSQSAEMPASL